MPKRLSIPTACVASILLALVVSACNPAPDPDPDPAETTGCIPLTMQNTMPAAREIAPGISLTPSEYRITGQGPSGASFSDSTAGATYTSDKVVAGYWTISVQAYNEMIQIGAGQGTVTVVAGQANNADDVEIGSREQTVFVAPSVITDVSITALPLTGDGTLSRDLSWTAPLARLQ